MKNLKLEKLWKIIKPYIKIEQKILKFDDTQIEDNDFHPSKKPISIKDIYINKIVASDKLPFGKKDFKYLIGYKYYKGLYVYAYSVQKWLCIEEIFIKLTTCICLIRDETFLINTMKFLEKGQRYWKKSIKKLYTTKHF